MSQCFGKWLGVYLYFNSLITLPQISDSVAVQLCFSTKIVETICVQESSSLILVVRVALYVLLSAKHSGILLAFSTRMFPWEKPSLRVCLKLGSH